MGSKLNTAQHPVHGKTAIVTGAAIGLGQAYARALAQHGANLALCDVREEVLELVPELEALGVRVLAWVGDVADQGLARRVTEGAATQLGSIDILVNNAGVWRESTAEDGLDKSLTDYELVINSNLKGHFLFGRAVIPAMISAGRGGEIINIATDHMVTCGTPWQVCPKLDTCPWAEAPRPTGGGDTMDLYDAAKWGLNGLLYGWAKACAPHGIRVNQICMGATDTHMLRAFYDFDPPPEEVATWTQPAEHAQVLIDLLAEGPTGRNAQNMNFCLGRPVKLEPPLPHYYVYPQQIKVEPARG